MKYSFKSYLVLLSGLTLLFVGLSTSIVMPGIAVAKDNKVDVCHIPPGAPWNFHSIFVSENALELHLDHGDKFVSCGLLSEVLCNDNDMCTIDAFIEGTVECIPLEERSPTDCDDNNFCTDDSCDSSNGCENIANGNFFGPDSVSVPETCDTHNFNEVCRNEFSDFADCEDGGGSTETLCFEGRFTTITCECTCPSG